MYTYLKIIERKCQRDKIKYKNIDCIIIKKLKDN